MRPVILLVGKLRNVIANVAHQHDDLAVEWLGAHTPEEVREQLEKEPRIATVIIGGSLDDSVRGGLIGLIAAHRPDLNIHVKNRASGPDGLAPFARLVAKAELPEGVV